MISLAVLFLVSLGLSAFSASEMAFVSSNKLQLRDMAEKGIARPAVVGLRRRPRISLQRS